MKECFLTFPIEPSTDTLSVIVLLQSQLPQNTSGRLWWSFATGLLGIVAVSMPGAAVNGNEKLEPGVPRRVDSELFMPPHMDAMALFAVLHRLLHRQVSSKSL